MVPVPHFAVIENKTRQTTPVLMEVNQDRSLLLSEKACSLTFGIPVYLNTLTYLKCKVKNLLSPSTLVHMAF